MYYSTHRNDDVEDGGVKEEEDDVENDDAEGEERMILRRRRTDPKTALRVLCEPAQSKCTWTFHKSHFIPKFTRKVLQARPRCPLCESLRNRNALRHFTKATLYGNLQEKCRAPD